MSPPRPAAGNPAERRPGVVRRRPRSPRRIALALVLAASLGGLAACGGRNPFDAAERSTPVATPARDASTRPTAAPPAQDAPSRPGGLADEPGPNGQRLDARARAGLPPRTQAERVAADRSMMLELRTLVSVVEGCHSGRDSYRACNTHGELGSPAQLGVEIGRRLGQIQITAGDRSFRMTGRSLTGGRFTVARAPKGDRFSCTFGPEPGACPPDRTWSW